MGHWVIGDVHGCFETLERLLRRIGWHSAAGDDLVLIGDLASKGPAALEVLRWARAHAGKVEAVLGNHDLHLLARAFGIVGPRPGDALDTVLAAPDREALIEWLWNRPLLLEESGWIVVHAGIRPTWDASAARAAARRIEAVLRGTGGVALLRRLYRPPRPGRQLGGDDDEEPAADLSVLTRLRFVDRSGRPCWGSDGPPEDAPAGCRPWFSGSHRARPPVVFGHWAALGLYRGNGVVGLDTGCVYGGSLSALRLEDGLVVQEPTAPGDAVSPTPATGGSEWRSHEGG